MSLVFCEGELGIASREVALSAGGLPHVEDVVVAAGGQHAAVGRPAHAADLHEEGD